MSFTYRPSESMSNVEKVRMLLADTDEADYLLEDEEIQAIGLDNYPSNIFRAAANCALMIAAHFGRKIQRSAMGMSDDPTSPAQFYRDLADDLISKSSTATALEMFSGGRSKDGKRDLATDDDKTQPAFAIGMDDAPGYRADPLTGRYNDEE